jgi:hypothetical protein
MSSSPYERFSLRSSSLLGGHVKRSGDDNRRSDERHDQIDGEQGDGRQLDQRRNRQNVPCPSRVLLVGEDFRRDALRASGHQQDKHYKHQLRAP